MSKSIIQGEDDKTCFLCQYAGYGLQKHHCISGTANRLVADKDGLWVWLCPSCHTMGPKAVHQAGGKERMRWLQKIAQTCWMEEYVHQHGGKEKDALERFRTRYGKSFL